MDKVAVQELRDIFDYHPDGYLIRRSTGKPCGQHANQRDGYVLVRVGKKKMLAHKVIYAIVHGKMPDGDIDHLDGNPMNNRIENLRDVSKSENQHNHKIPKNNTSGFTGVTWSTNHRKWQAQIKVGNQSIYLGRFENFEDAVEARKKAKIRYHPTSPEAA